MKTRTLGWMVVVLAGGCASVAPVQLIEARQAYEQTRDGVAAKLTPTELYDAKKVLDKADRELEEHGDTLAVRDYAYIAYRKIQLTEVKARTELDRQRIVAAMKAGVKLRDRQVKDSHAALQATREQLKDERREMGTVTNELRAANSAATKELEKTAAQLESERQARLTAEQKLAGAMKDLAAVAAVKEETRGVVITLSGSVLFVSGKFALLNTAQSRLDQVAEALKSQPEDKRIIVEGHTDSMGSDAINLPLSMNRANAVREYLLTRGVAAARITAVGLGSSRPLVDNNTAENRANNRRVEIIISPAAFSVR